MFLLLTLAFVLFLAITAAIWFGASPQSTVAGNQPVARANQPSHSNYSPDANQPSHANYSPYANQPSHANHSSRPFIPTPRAMPAARRRIIRLPSITPGQSPYEYNVGDVQGTRGSALVRAA